MVGRRCLIVANQTLGGRALYRSVRDCISRDVSVFFVVVPTTPVKHETTAWAGGFAVSVEGESPDPDWTDAVMAQNARERAAELDEEKSRAEHRLELMIQEIRAMGGEAEGTVGPADPLEATRLALKDQSPFAEIIVSTLPSGLSRWLKMDLPNRVARMTDVPVTTIEADSAADSW